MTVITVNGKKSPREFQNMAQALSFAVNSGECRNAEKLEISCAAKAGVKKDAPHEGSAASPADAGSGPAPVSGNAGTGGGKK